MKDRKDRGLYIPGKLLIAPKAILPEGYILPSTAPIPGNPQASFEMPETPEKVVPSND